MFPLNRFNDTREHYLRYGFLAELAQLHFLWSPKWTSVPLVDLWGIWSGSLPSLAKSRRRKRCEPIHRGSLAILVGRTCLPECKPRIIGVPRYGSSREIATVPFLLTSVIIPRCHPRFSRIATSSPTTMWSGWWSSMCPPSCHTSD